jgi:hypothetical protein
MIGQLAPSLARTRRCSTAVPRVSPADDDIANGIQPGGILVSNASSSANVALARLGRVAVTSAPAAPPLLLRPRSGGLLAPMPRLAANTIALLAPWIAVRFPAVGSRAFGVREPAQSVLMGGFEAERR